MWSFILKRLAQGVITVWFIATATFFAMHNVPGDPLLNDRAMTAAIRRKMFESPEEFDPRVFFKAAIISAQQVCKDRFEAFGSAGKASQIKVIPMDVMAIRYTTGELNPVVY